MDINNTAISNKLLFCKDRNINYNLKKNDTQDLTAFGCFLYCSDNILKFIVYL